MLDVSKDIRSLSDFKRETPKFLDELKVNGRALVLTVNDEAELAVMSAATFQRVLEAFDLLPVHGHRRPRRGAPPASRQ